MPTGLDTRSATTMPHAEFLASLQRPESASSSSSCLEDGDSRATPGTPDSDSSDVSQHSADTHESLLRAAEELTDTISISVDTSGMNKCPETGLPRPEELVAAISQSSFARAAIASSRNKRERGESPMDDPSGCSDAGTVTVLAGGDEGVRQQDAAARRRAELDADETWMTNLDATRHGQHIMEHLTHTQGLLNAPEAPMESSIDQCCTLRRAFVKALADNQTAFNIPKKLPRYVALVNLCGRRMILYSNRPVLFQLLAHTASSANKSAIAQMEAGVKEMFGFMHRNKPVSCLLCYSLPFACGLEQVHWEMRIFRRHGKGDVRDGTLCFHLGDERGPTPGQTTQSAESEFSASMLQDVIKEMAANLTAVDLDVSGESVDASMSGVVDKRVEVLEQLCTRLQHERKTSQETHRAEIKSIEEKNAIELAKAAMSHGETYAQTNATEKMLREQLDKITRESLANLNVADAANAEMNALRSELTGKNVELEEQIAVFRTDMKKVEKQLSAAQKKVVEANDLRQRELKKRDELHSKTAEGLEKRLAAAQLDAQKARAEGEDYLHKMQTLSHTMDSGDAVKEALGLDIETLKRQARGHKCALAVGCIKYEQRTDELKKARLAHVEADAALKDARKEVKAQKRVAEQAAQRAERFSKDRDAAEKEVAKLKAENDALKMSPPAPAPVVLSLPFKPEMVDSDTMTVPTTSRADLELGELQTTHAKVQDDLEQKMKEIDHLRSELARAKSRAAKKATPPSFMTTDSTTAPTTAGPKGDSAVLGAPVGQTQGGQGYQIINHVTVGGGNAQLASTDLGHDPTMEPSVEAIIQQAAVGLRTLADMARDSHRHKAAANDFCSQLRSLQNYTGYQAPMGTMQQMGMGHMQGGYHGGY